MPGRTCTFFTRDYIRRRTSSIERKRDKKRKKIKTVIVKKKHVKETKGFSGGNVDCFPLRILLDFRVLGGAALEWSIGVDYVCMYILHIHDI